MEVQSAWPLKRTQANLASETWELLSCLQVAKRRFQAQALGILQKGEKLPKKEFENLLAHETKSQ